MEQLLNNIPYYIRENLLLFQSMILILLCILLVVVAAQCHKISQEIRKIRRGVAKYLKVILEEEVKEQSEEQEEQPVLRKEYQEKKEEQKEPILDTREQEKIICDILGEMF